MRNRITVVLVGAVALAMLCVFAQTVAADEKIVRMAMDELKARIDDPDVVIVDARINRDWNASKHKIKGAVRIDPKGSDSWLDAFPKTSLLVFY